MNVPSRSALALCVVASFAAACNVEPTRDASWWAQAGGTFDDGVIVRELEPVLPYGDFGGCGRVGHAWTLRLDVEGSVKTLDVRVSIESPTKDRELDVRPLEADASFGELVDPQTGESVGLIWFGEVVETADGRARVDWNVVGGTAHVISADGGPPLDTHVEATVEVAATDGMTLPSGTFDVVLIMGGTEEFGDRAGGGEPGCGFTAARR